MIAVVQRVLQASVSVEGEVIGRIGAGMCVLAAVEAADSEAEIQWMAGKLATFRIFRGQGKHFDQDIKQIGGSILLVSNFTVAAETAKGRRPSLSGAAPPQAAEGLFNRLLTAVRAQGVPVETGRFGASMMVEITNDGPATFIVKSSPS